MTEEKFVELQEMGGELAIVEEFEFDLQRFVADDADDTDDSTDDTDDATDDTDDATDDTDDATDDTDDATDDTDDSTDDTDDSTDDADDSTDDADDSDSDSDSDADSDADSDSGKEETKENELAGIDNLSELVEKLGLESDQSTLVSGSGDKSLTMDDVDLVVVDTTNANITAGSSGADTLIAKAGATATFDLSKSNNADMVVMQYSTGRVTEVTFKGYKSSTGAGVATGETSTSGIREAAIGGGMEFGNSAITFSDGEDGKSRIVFDASATDTTPTYFNLYTQDGSEVQKGGFTGAGGGKLDTSKQSGDFLLVGNWKERNYDSSTITGGSGDDTALAGGGDVIDLGAGQNMVRFNADDTNRDSATVVISQGRTSLRGSNNSLEDEGDVLQAKDFSNASVSYDENGNLVVKGDGYRGVIEGLEATDGVVTQKFSDGSNEYKAAIATEAGANIDASNGANHFQGNNADGVYTTVDFSNYEGSVNIDLNGTSSVGGATATFKDVKSFQLGDDDSAVKGGSGNESLGAGLGNSTLNGGGGRNVLTGTADNENRDGRTTFDMSNGSTANGAQNTITNFMAASDVEDNSLADVITMGDNIVSNVFINNAGNVVMDFSSRDGSTTQRAVVENVAGKDIYVTEGVVAQVNTTSLDYDGNASFFVATGKNASISIDNESALSANIWLGNQSTNQFRGDIRTIDARGFDGKAELAGGDANDTIYGGAGANSLWGGNGGDDLLVGGTGSNLFFYTNGNGNDTIEGCNDGDVVYLAAVTFENIASTDFSSGAITINFNDGGKLIINDESKDVGVVIGDQTYYVKSDRSDWSTNKGE